MVAGSGSGSGGYGELQLQFDTWATWAEFGGQELAQNARQATREQQITVAERVLAVQGPGAWPQCSLSAGVRPATTSDGSRRPPRRHLRES